MNTKDSQVVGRYHRYCFMCKRNLKRFYDVTDLNIVYYGCNASVVFTNAWWYLTAIKRFFPNCGVRRIIDNAVMTFVYLLPMVEMRQWVINFHFNFVCQLFSSDGLSIKYCHSPHIYLTQKGVAKHSMVMTRAVILFNDSSRR